MPESVATPWQSALLERHQLDEAYLDTARAWFDRLAQSVANYQREQDRPVLIGVNGSQGCGKTTFSDYLQTALRHVHGLKAVALSLDDFYLTHAERQSLAARIHPLLATRGVPGTHDVNLLLNTLHALLDPENTGTVSVPRFDKATDDRRDAAGWDQVAPGLQVVLLEGWCLGATPEPEAVIANPINTLEREEDSQGSWRSYVNDALRLDYPPLYDLIDQWIMLQAPSFDCVFDWRQEQERKLASTLLPEQSTQLMNDQALGRFIQHYERLTRHCLSELPHKVDHLLTLDLERRITAYRRGPSSAASR